MSDSIKIHSPRQFLSAVPALLGFIPSEDYVVCLTNDDSILGVTIRQDVLDNPAAAESVAESVRMAVAKVPAITRAIIVVVTEHQERQEHGVIVDTCAELGLHVVDALYVTGGKAGSYLCDNPTCLCSFDFAFDTVGLRGNETAAPSRDALRKACEYDPSLTYDRTDLDLDPRHVVSLLTMAVEHSTLGVGHGVTITRALRDDNVHRRDIIMATAPLVPSWAIQRLAQHTDEPSERAALAGLAWAAGDGALARILVDSSPGVSLAVLISHGLDQAIPPYEWRAMLAQSLPESIAHYVLES